MRRLWLLLLLILVECCVVQSSCGTAGPARQKCLNKGNKAGVKASCLLKTDETKCTGRFYNDYKYCENSAKENCGCCVPDTGTHVQTAFRLENTEYNDNLTDHQSEDYKALVKKVQELVLDNIREKDQKIVINFLPEFFFFRPGSDIDSTGKADSVIVDSNVITKEQKNQKTADRKVKRALEKSNIRDLDKSSISVGVRLCMAGNQDSNACTTMKVNNPKLHIICVQARDRYKCLQYLKNEEVDVVYGDAADIYVASELDNNQFNVFANSRDEDKVINVDYQYGAVAVVRRATIHGIHNLNGSKSCHTGYGKTSGWYVPLSKLVQMQQFSCDTSLPVLEENLNAFSSYFGEACIPGKWSPDIETDITLKSNYSNLCRLCADPGACSANDTYAGYEGALNCLINGNDVAWTKLEAVKNFFKSSGGDSSEFGILCTNGSIIDVNSENPCYWAQKPWPGWLIRANETDTKGVLSAIKNWAKDVLGFENKSVEKLLPLPTPKEYLGQGSPAGYYITISNPGCVGKNVSFCVEDDIALQKCRDLSQVLKSRRVRPLLTCVRNDTDNCITTVANGTADIVTLDGGDVFSGYRKYENIPVISEAHEKYDLSYFAVAVVKANSGIKTLADLEGKKSCHTGINKTAGWNMPLITLLNAKLLNREECNYTGQVGDFFADSCAPGALLSDYNRYGTNPPSLCELCVGNGNGSDVCDRSSKELYYGYTGAFRCLVEGGGDVAFVKQTTVPANTDLDGHGPLWTKGQNSTDYRLLCKDGGTKEVDEFENCNLARVPSHKVVTGSSTNDVQRTNIRTLLLLASEKLPPNQNVFVMFGDYGTYQDVLFKNSATSLVNFPNTAFADLKEGTYWQALKALEECTD